MMELFRSSRRHLAVVIDTNEAMLGIVTFEDVLEEIVGEIRDELDIETRPDLRAKPSSSIVVDASLAHPRTPRGDRLELSSISRGRPSAHGSSETLAGSLQRR